MYPNDFHVDIDYEPRINDINYWKQYQIVHIHRNIGNVYEHTPNIVRMLKSLGIITIIDIDDYWMPGKEHPIHDIIRQNKINEKIVENLKHPDYVTTTTTIFANELKKLNKKFGVPGSSLNREAKDAYDAERSTLSGLYVSNAIMPVIYKWFKDNERNKNDKVLNVRVIQKLLEYTSSRTEKSSKFVIAK